jgi:peptidoglycan/LPS O-acetylase OafA/YrhL
LFWSGAEPVYVFFVLSGFVLLLPLIDRQRPSWPAFWSKRVVRLYVPACIAILLAAAITLLIPREFDARSSLWMQENVISLTPQLLAKDATLLTTPSNLNGPLWSLRYEVLFSALVPLYLFAVIRWRRLWPLKLLVLSAAIAFGAAGDPAHAIVYKSLLYFAMFGFGAMIAVERDGLTRWVERRTRMQGALLVVAALLLLSARSLTVSNESPVLEVVSVFGAALLLVLFLAHQGTMRVGDACFSQWIGKRSFSLYLTHLPIVVSVTLLFSTTNPALVLLVSLPISLLLAAMFYRLVELPSHRLATSVSKRVAHLSGP